MVLNPFFEAVRNVIHLVLGGLFLIFLAVQRRFKVCKFVLVECFFIHQDRNTNTHTLGMPTRELERLWVTTNQAFTQVTLALWFMI